MSNTQQRISIGLIGGTAKLCALLKHLQKIGIHPAWAILQHPDPSERDPSFEITKKILAEEQISWAAGDDAPIEEIVASFDKKVDVIFCTGWRRLLPKSILEGPHEGCLVAHDSLLPAFRGRATLNWQIILGQSESGLTLFRADEKVDHGLIFAQEKIEIGPNESIVEASEKINALIGPLYARWIEAKISGQLLYFEQKHEKATYTCTRSAKDSLIDWKMSAQEIHNLVRALAAPWPQAYTFLNGQRLEIAESEILKDAPRYLGRVPGRVVSVSKEGADLLCGADILRVKLLTLQDGSTHPAQEIVKSVRDTFSDK